MEDKLEEVHEELLAWAEGLGVRLRGIRPMRLSGRGFGSKSTQLFAFPKNLDRNGTRWLAFRTPRTEMLFAS